MTWYVPRPQSMMTYSELYSSVSLVNIGLSLDVNINRIFWKNTSGHRLTAWISQIGIIWNINSSCKTKGKQ